MATGLLTTACLLVALCADTDGAWPVNSLKFDVPIQLQSARKQDVKQLILYASGDQGRNWSKVAVAAPDKEKFQFQAPADGVYLLTLCVEDKKGKVDPADPKKVPPSIRILVDTLKPVVGITSAERQGDDIVVHWAIQEEHPDLNSLRLEYRPGDSTSNYWITVPVPGPQLVGHARFRAPGPGAVSVRLQIEDMAKNAGSAVSEVAAAPAPITPAAANNVVPPPAPAPAFSALQPTPPAPVPTPGYPQPNPTPAYPPNGTPSWETARPPAPLARNDVPPPDNSYAGSSASKYQLVNASEPSTRVLATSEHPGGSGASPAAAARPARPTNAQKQIINTRQVSLNYEVRNAGPSGLGKAVLWLTEDDGKSWRPYAEDTSVGVGGGVPSPQRVFTTELPREGTFGLRLVLLSKAGLGQREPAANDPPDFVVEVDLTKPDATLLKPEPDPNTPNAVWLSWTANDRNQNLPSNPVTLQWAEKRGDWKVIRDGLPSTGRFSWTLPGNCPGEVFLRMVVRDNAGNERVVETSQPELIDLSRPEGTILGVSPGGR